MGKGLRNSRILWCRRMFGIEGGISLEDIMNFSLSTYNPVSNLCMNEFIKCYETTANSNHTKYCNFSQFGKIRKCSPTHCKFFNMQPKLLQILWHSITENITNFLSYKINFPFHKTINTLCYEINFPF